MRQKKQQFIAQVAELERGIGYTVAGTGIFEPGDIAVTVLPHLRGGQLFAYLFRRFGYPSWGWDDHKELTHYLITTPLPHVFLEVRPYMGGDYPGAAEEDFDRTQLMFGYCVSRTLEKEYEQCLRKDGYAAWDEHPLHKECNAAFEAAVRDLLRPVYVRDVPINCYGCVEDKDFKKLPKPEAERYHAAGYPIPAILLKDTERYEQFWDALKTLGQGSAEKGMEAVIKTAASVSFTEEVLKAETQEEKQELLREAGLSSHQTP